MAPIFWPATMQPQGAIVTTPSFRAHGWKKASFNTTGCAQGMHSICVARFLREDSVSGVIGMLRDDSEVLNLLLPHLRRAVQMQSRMNTLAQHGRLTAAALDAPNHVILIVDAASPPDFVNRAAQRLPDYSDGLNATTDGITAMTLRITLALRELVARDRPSWCGERQRDQARAFARPTSLGMRWSTLCTSTRTGPACIQANRRC